MTLTGIQALAAEGGFPLAFTHREIELAGAFVFIAPDAIVVRAPFGDFNAGFADVARAGFRPADGWYPLGGFR